MIESIVGTEVTLHQDHCTDVRYAIEDATASVVDVDAILVRARLLGPEGEPLMGRAWVSDEDGGLAESVTDDMEPGSEIELRLLIQTPRPQNGDLIVCVRVEWPEFDTKLVRTGTLLKGRITQPPTGKRCG